MLADKVALTGCLLHTVYAKPLYFETFFIWMCRSCSIGS